MVGVAVGVEVGVGVGALGSKSTIPHFDIEEAGELAETEEVSNISVATRLSEFEPSLPLVEPDEIVTDRFPSAVFFLLLNV